MRISVQPLLPTGNYLNCRIGIEQDFPEDTNIETAVNTLWDSITAIHMKRYPHLYNEDGTVKYEMYKGEEPTKKVTTIEENEPLTPLEKMKLAINSCTDITVLESFKLLVSKNKEGLQETYDNKLKQLTK